MSTWSFRFVKAEVSFAKDVRRESARLRFGSAPPFSELFPGLHEFLNCARRRNLAVYDLTIAVGTLINFAYGVLAQESEVASNFRQVCPAEELLISGIGPACHG